MKILAKNYVFQRFWRSKSNCIQIWELHRQPRYELAGIQVIWTNFRAASVSVIGVAVTIHCIDRDKVIGDIYELDYTSHSKELGINSKKGETAEIFYQPQSDKINGPQSTVLKMEDYNVVTYWNNTVASIKFRVESERSLMQSIRGIIEKREKSAISGDFTEYLKDIEKQSYINYITIHDGKNSSKQQNKNKAEMYEKLKQANYIFVSPDEAKLANQFTIPNYALQRTGEFKSIRSEVEIAKHSNDGGYFCISKSSNDLMKFIQLRPRLPYTELELIKIRELAQNSYDQADEKNKLAIGGVIAKLAIILDIHKVNPDQIILLIEIRQKKQLETKAQVAESSVHYIHEDTIDSEILVAENSPFTVEERKQLKKFQRKLSINQGNSRDEAGSIFNLAEENLKTVIVSNPIPDETKQVVEATRIAETTHIFCSENNIKAR